MLIAAKYVRIKKPRRCFNLSCGRMILPGERAIRAYGAAEPGNPPYVIYLHDSWACCGNETWEKVHGPPCK